MSAFLMRVTVCLMFAGLVAGLLLHRRLSRLCQPFRENPAEQKLRNRTKRESDADAPGRVRDRIRVEVSHPVGWSQTDCGWR